MDFSNGIYARFRFGVEGATYETSVSKAMVNALPLRLRPIKFVLAQVNHEFDDEFLVSADVTQEFIEYVTMRELVVQVTQQRSNNCTELYLFFFPKY